MGMDPACGTACCIFDCSVTVFVGIPGCEKYSDRDGAGKTVERGPVSDNIVQRMRTDNRVWAFLLRLALCIWNAGRLFICLLSVDPEENRQKAAEASGGSGERRTIFQICCFAASADSLFRTKG